MQLDERRARRHGLILRRVVIFSIIISEMTWLGLSAVYGKPAPRTSQRQSRSDPVENAAAGLALNSANPTENLQKACARSDFKLLALGLEGIRSRISRPKGEFETAAEYDARIGKIEALLNAPEPIIICQPLSDNDDAPFRYDADRELFKGSFRPQQNVWRDVKRLGSYVSRTRMGVKAKVTSSLELEYNVTMGESLRAVGRTCGKADTLGYSYEVAVPRSEAPRVKAHGHLVFLGRLVAPFVDSDDTPGSPTLDDPHDNYERDLTVYFEPSEIAVIGPDGRRLWECSLAAVASNQAAPLIEAAPAAGQPSPGKFWLQLASAASADGLAEQYRRIKGRNTNLLAGIKAFVARGPDRARLVIGPFRSAGDADTFAEELLSGGVTAFRWSNSNESISPLGN